MALSLASNNSSQAIEVATAVSPLPDNFQQSAANILLLVNAYYAYLNENGLPSEVIRNTNINHDIDTASEFYLDAIERQIAKTIPQSRTLDRRRLYKIIAKYYLSRGSDDSIYAFFRIFYNEFITITFPKERLLHSSDDQSISSDVFRIQDSYKWQEFSYLISSDKASTEWKSELLRFVHPAGLKLFVALTVLSVALNEWHEDMESYLISVPMVVGSSPPVPDIDMFWKYIDWDTYFGQHTPRMQPNIEAQLAYLFKVLMPDGGFHYLTHVRNVYDEAHNVLDKDLLKAFYEFLTLCIIVTNEVSQTELVYDDYQVGGKFRDPGAFIDGYGDYTIESTHTDTSNVIAYDKNTDVRFGWSGINNVQDYFTRSFSIPEDDAEEWVNDTASPPETVGEVSEITDTVDPLYDDIYPQDFYNSRVYLQGFDDEFVFTQ